MYIDDTAIKVHKLSREKGWYEGVSDPPTIDQILAKLSLIHSEVSEAVECARNGEMGITYGDNGKPEGFPIEVADVVIRAMDLMEFLGFSLETAIKIKHEYNKTRSHRHGGKLA